MKPDLTAIIGGKVITPFRVITEGVILVEGELIKEIGAKQSVSIPPTAKKIDYHGKLICPGFIDLHIHGYGGILLGNLENSPLSAKRSICEDVKLFAKKIIATGITSFLPTLLISSDYRDIVDIMSEMGNAIQDHQDHGDGAEILGIHLEGPYFNPSDQGPFDRYHPRGAQPSKYFRKPDVAEINDLLDVSNNELKMVCLSPEIDGAIDYIKELRNKEIIASGAHSFASYIETMRAVDAGMNTVTHMYNGMRRQDHREPGIIEASLVNDQIVIQIIADGIHVHQPAFEIALRCKGKENIAITTDNMPYAGMPNGSYVDVTGRPLLKTDQIVQIVDGPLFGCVMPMNRQLATIYQNHSWPIEDIIYMATVTPARLIGREGSKGSLEKGKDADILILDENFDIHGVFCKGTLTYRS